MNRVNMLVRLCKHPSNLMGRKKKSSKCTKYSGTCLRVKVWECWDDFKEHVFPERIQYISEGPRVDAPLRVASVGVGLAGSFCAQRRNAIWLKPTKVMGAIFHTLELHLLWQ